MLPVVHEAWWYLTIIHPSSIIEAIIPNFSLGDSYNIKLKVGR